jgi:phosphoribosylformimino-5-aminoimidazole carboxamide ribotide isomerase
MKKWPYQGGWKNDEDLIPFIQGYQAKGIKHVICTDIAKDGMLEGPSFDLYAKILAEAKGIKLPRVEFLPLMNCQN